MIEFDWHISKKGSLSNWLSGWWLRHVSKHPKETLGASIIHCRYLKIDEVLQLALKL
jgi:hypothetical protein